MRLRRVRGVAMACSVAVIRATSFERNGFVHE
jgi:hypothetical protein